MFYPYPCAAQTLYSSGMKTALYCAVVVGILTALTGSWFFAVIGWLVFKQIFLMRKPSVGVLETSVLRIHRLLHRPLSLNFLAKPLRPLLPQSSAPRLEHRASPDLQLEFVDVCRGKVRGTEQPHSQHLS